MLPFAPTADEKVLLEEYKGPLESLGAAEQYYLSTIHIPRLAQRLRCWDIAFKFEARVEFVQAQLEAGILTCRAIKTSKAFKRFLDLVLTVGNVLNAGGFRGSAAAVSSLEFCDCPAAICHREILFGVVYQNWSRLLRVPADVPVPPRLVSACSPRSKTPNRTRKARRFSTFWSSSSRNKNARMQCSSCLTILNSSRRRRRSTFRT